MTRSLPAILAVLAAIPAAYAQGFSDDARVIDSRPLYDEVPLKREECWNERVRGYENRTITRTDTGASIGAGTVLGAIVGGVVGHQFGNSSGGRDRATGAGAIVGGLIGNQIERDNRSEGREVTSVERVPTERNVERCRMVEEVRQVASGYEVRYTYAGRTFTTRMNERPGTVIRVSVDVRPIDDGPGFNEAHRPPAPRPRPRY